MCFVLRTSKKKKKTRRKDNAIIEKRVLRVIWSGKPPAVHLLFKGEKGMHDIKKGGVLYFILFYFFVLEYLSSAYTGVLR